MSFRNLLIVTLVPGCALIDAAGKAQPATGGAHLENLAMGASPKQALPANLDGMFGTDVVVLDEGGGLQTALSQDGGMYKLTAMPLFTGYTSLAVADLGETPLSEVIAAGPGKLDMYRSMQDGFLARFPITVPGSFMPGKIAVGTILGNAAPVIAVASANSGQVFVFSNPLGNATMATVSVGTMPPDDIACADVDSSAPGDELVVAEDQAIVAFSGPTMTRKDQPLRMGNGRATHIAAGHMRQGTEADVAYMHIFQGPAEVDVLFGSPTGLFDGTGGFASGVVGDDLIAADIDGDGTTDLATIFSDNTGKRHVVTLHAQNNGSGIGFTQNDFTVGGNPQRLGVADLDGDGFADYMLAPGASGGIDLLLSR